MKKAVAIRISPFVCSGEVNASASKSAMQRACALALLHQGLTVIENPGSSNDDRAALQIIEQLGATVNYSSKNLQVAGPAEIRAKDIFCGESGLSIRMFTPIASLASAKIKITGEGSLLTRPMNVFEDIFPKLSVAFSSNNGFLPLEVTGPLRAENISLDGSLSSQFLTGFLIALAHQSTKQITVDVQALKSKPYIDLTLQMMEKFGYNIVNEGYQRFIISPKTFCDKEVNVVVEGDWSGAAFLLVAGAIGGEVIVSGLQINSVQADKKIIEALQAAGAEIIFDENKIVVRKKILKPFIFDATECPDLFPPLVALAAVCAGRSTIKGVSRLAHKESDRGVALQQEFAKMGVSITLLADEMYIDGAAEIKGTQVKTHADHRIAMALAVMATQTDEPIVLDDALVINKSYPQFYEHLSLLGAQCDYL